MRDSQFTIPCSQCIATVIFSTTPNSMAEERTVSVISSINSAKRNRQHVATIVNQTQIRQFYGFDPNKHAQQRQNHPTPRFSALKKFRTPRYIDDADSSESEEEGEEEEEARHNDRRLSPNFSSAVRQILGDINPESAALAGLLDSDAASNPAVPKTPAQPSAKQGTPLSLVKDDDEYPEL